MILKNIPLQDIPSGSNICIYGTGDFGRLVFNQLQALRPDVVVSCFADTFKSGEFSGKPLYSFEQLDTAFKGIDSIAIASAFALDIFKSLAPRLEGAALEVYEIEHPLYASGTFAETLVNRLEAAKKSGSASDLRNATDALEQNDPDDTLKVLKAYFTLNSAKNCLTSNSVNTVAIEYAERHFKSFTDQDAAVSLLYTLHIAQGNWTDAEKLLPRVEAIFAPRKESGTQQYCNNIIVTTLPKSGTVFLKRSLSYLYDLSIQDITSSSKLLTTFDKYRVNPNAAFNFFLSNNVCIDHIPYENMTVLAENAPADFKVVVHLRDPRQHLLSFFKMFESHLESRYSLLNRDIYCYFGIDWRKYEKMSVTEKLDLYVEKSFPNALHFIQEWIENTNKWDNIIYTDYERDFARDNASLIKIIAQFYGRDFTDMHRSWLKKPQKGQLNFRKGSVDEWRNAFTREQQRKMWQSIPSNVKEFMDLKE